MLSYKKATTVDMWLEWRIRFTVVNDKSYETLQLRNKYYNPKHFISLPYLTKLDLAFHSQND